MGQSLTDVTKGAVMKERIRDGMVARANTGNCQQLVTVRILPWAE